MAQGIFLARVGFRLTLGGTVRHTLSMALHTPTNPFPKDPIFDGVEDLLLSAEDCTGFPSDDLWLYEPEPGDEDYEPAEAEREPPEPEPPDPDYGDMEADRYERAYYARADRY